MIDTVLAYPDVGIAVCIVILLAVCLLLPLFKTRRR